MWRSFDDVVVLDVDVIVVVVVDVVVVGVVDVVVVVVVDVVVVLDVVVIIVVVVDVVVVVVVVDVVVVVVDDVVVVVVFVVDVWRSWLSFSSVEGSNPATAVMVDCLITLTEAVVTGVNSCLSSCGFESRCHILDGHFSH